jgi:hypothetical protein
VGSITGLGLVSGIAVPLGDVLVRMRAGCLGVGFAVAGRGSWGRAGRLWTSTFLATSARPLRIKK